jgi:hypothetical protein
MPAVLNHVRSDYAPHDLAVWTQKLPVGYRPYRYLAKVLLQRQNLTRQDQECIMAD